MLKPTHEREALDRDRKLEQMSYSCFYNVPLVSGPGCTDTDSSLEVVLDYSERRHPYIVEINTLNGSLSAYLHPYLFRQLAIQLDKDFELIAHATERLSEAPEEF